MRTFAPVPAGSPDPVKRLNARWIPGKLRDRLIVQAGCLDRSGDLAGRLQEGCGPPDSCYLYAVPVKQDEDRELPESESTCRAGVLNHR